MASGHGNTRRDGQAHGKLIAWHVEKRGKRGWNSMVLEYEPYIDTSKEPHIMVRDRVRESIKLPSGVKYLKKTDAEEILQARVEEIKNRVQLDIPKPITLAEHLRAYLEVCEGRKLRKTTIRGYKNCIERHLIPRLGDRLLTELEPEDVRDRLITPMTKAGFSARTVELCYVVLHGALGQALTDKKVYRNACDGVNPPRPRRQKLYRTLRPEEVGPLLAYIKQKDKQMYYFGGLIIYTGLARSEILAEEWPDIDLDNASLAVTKGVTVTDAKLNVDEPKNEHRKRLIPLLPEAVEMLCEMKAGATCDLLFHDENGKHLNPGTVSHRFGRLAAEAGFPGITPHKLRHTFATNMLRAGVSIKYVSTLLGHASVKTTGDIYAHVIDDDLRQAVNIYGESMRKNGKKAPAPIRHQPQDH